MFFQAVVSRSARIGRASLLAIVFLVIAAGFAPDSLSAAEPLDPVRLVPPSTDLIVKIDRPRVIADLAVNLVSRPELGGFRGYRDYFESTNYQLFKQLVGHFERELGNRWADLLDELAGDGVVLAIKFEKNGPAPTLVIIQGHDPKLLAKFFQKALDVAQQEQARQGIHDGYTRDSYRDTETLHRGDKIHSALLGSAFVYSNTAARLHDAIDLYLDSSKGSLLAKKEYADAKQLVPGDALVWAWVNLEFAHKSEELKPIFALPANFFPFHVAFGGLIDSLRRSPYLVTAIKADVGGGTLSLRLPAGTSGMHELVHAHVPRSADRWAAPLLEPDGVLYSASYYLDLAEFWKQRAVLLPADQLKQIEDGNKKSAVFLAGNQFSKFLEMEGPRQRFVVARQKVTGYSMKPNAQQPAFALVTELRDPEAFTKAIDAPIKTGAFLAGLRIPMAAFEEERGGTKILGYKFVENEANKALGDGVLFNFTPSRARIGNQYVFSSSAELTRSLIDALEKETALNADDKSADSGATESKDNEGIILHSQLSFKGLSNYLGATKRQLVAQNMLQQGNSPEDADKEVSLFLELLDHLGRVESTTRYLPDQYQIDLRVVP
jgi:hypothetical protein